MKYYPRLRQFKASNVMFDPVKCSAWSYGWWQFVKKIDNKVVFNKYCYSVSTAGHQRKVRLLLDELNVRIDYFVETVASLDEKDWKRLAVMEIESNRMEVFEKLAKLKNKEGVRAKSYLEQMRQLTTEINQLRQIGD